MVKVTLTAPSEVTVKVNDPVTCAPDVFVADQATDVDPTLIGFGSVTTALMPSEEVRLPRMVKTVALVL